MRPAGNGSLPEALQIMKEKFFRPWYRKAPVRSFR